MKRPRFTIERIRTAVLIGGGVLVAAIAIFLGLGQWRLYRQVRDLPKRLGIDIQQQADGINYTQSHKGKTLFRIHAARAVQMKINGKMLLHDVRIDLYGEDGSRTDTISGAEFEYDRSSGIAQAAGAVEITVARPGVKPAITQLMPGAARPATESKRKQDSADREVHVKTSGLIFNQNTGVATTAERVDFALQQGNGTSIGATYDSANGHLVLDRSVELHVERDGDPVTVRASHAEFQRSAQLCHMTGAQADYSGGTVATGDALIHFREDGSVLRLDGSSGVDVKTNAGSHLTAPRGNVDFDEQNHPQHGLLDGGTTMDLVQPTRHVQGTAPTMRLLFTGEGQLRQAHLERGVFFSSRQQTVSAKGAVSQLDRSWKSQVADIDFAPAAGKSGMQRGTGANGRAATRVEPKTIHGTGGVVVTADSAATREGSHLAADAVVAELAPGGSLSSFSGTGHAHFDQQTVQGAHQASSSDQLDVRFLLNHEPEAHTAANRSLGAAENAQIASITQVGDVVFTQDPPASKARQPEAASKAGSAAALQSPLRATASRADYDGPSEILHLTGSPRVQNGELDMTANQIDFARITGDALAHGNVKASWANATPARSGSASGMSLLNGSGGQASGGPMHAIADDAELHQSSQEVIFRAKKTTGAPHSLPRLWQASNSVSAPTIVLNRQKQTLSAEGDGPGRPVRTVLVTAESNRPVSNSVGSPGRSPSPETKGPSIIRIRSGDLHYSEGERVALLHADSNGSVIVETSNSGEASTVVAQQVQVKLLPAGVHAANRNSAPTTSPANGSAVDQVIASGHVSVDWPDRRGTGDRLVYLAEQGTFTLTGTSAAPPRVTDAIHGNVTGYALVFHNGDRSVTVDGDGSKTVTETQSPKKRSAAN